ncbi:MAG: winged helix-turn-helix domain-containing protein [Candidatus Bathyarchaeia archaeon]
MGSYRDRVDIIADILQAASREAKKTQIMYQANLSYKVLQRYLSEVTDATLVQFQSENQSYLITSKGQDYLSAYKEYARTNKSIEKRLNDFSNKKRVLEDLCPYRDAVTATQ